MPTWCCGDGCLICGAGASGGGVTEAQGGMRLEEEAARETCKSAKRCEVRGEGWAPSADPKDRSDHSVDDRGGGEGQGGLRGSFPRVPDKQEGPSALVADVEEGREP